MGRRSKVVGFSLPPEIHQKLERLIKVKHKTRSEFFREMIDVYFTTVKETQPKIAIEESDLAKVLKTYWLLKSQTKVKTLIIGLGIIVNDQQRVLIGARKEKDKWVKNLSWVFPGGLMDSLEFEKELKKEVKQETGLEVEVKSLIAARIHPDSGFKPVQIVALFFYCSPSGNQKPKAGGDLKKLKWVQPTDVFKYFTTSTCDEVTKFLTTIQYSSR